MNVTKLPYRLSLTLLGISCLLFGVSFLVNPWDYRISLNDDFHIGLLNGNIVFFNDAEYGPYRGSIIGLVDENGNVFPPLEREVRWGYTLGIYYRYFRWADSTLWTLNVLLLWPIAVFGITLASFGYLSTVGSPASNLRQNSDSNSSESPGLYPARFHLLTNSW